MDPRPPREGFGPLIDQVRAVKRQTETLAAPGGTQKYRAVAELQKLVDELAAQVEAMAETIIPALIDSKVANPGTINPTNVNASGTIKAPQTANNLINNFRTVVLDDDGTYGISASSERYKEDITPYTITDEQFRAGAPVEYKYIGSDQVHTGFIAERFVAAGLVEPVFFDSDGNPEGMNYQSAVPYVWAQLLKVMDRLDQLEGE